MQVVILAGGQGTRISDENTKVPKPLVEIGSIPILIHLMKYFSSFGHRDFVLLLGYKSHEIKRYFLEFDSRLNDIQINLARNTSLKLESSSSMMDWNVTLLDTGIATMTGGRVLRAKKYLESEFFLTYGDGLSDVNLDELLFSFRENGTIGTVTAVNPPSRYGAIELEGKLVKSFQEKPVNNSWINGGFFVFQKTICDFIEGDNSILERSPLENLTKSSQLSAYLHRGFWLGMDTPRDRDLLEDLWQRGSAPWERP